jgi:hypothetical protein
MSFMVSALLVAYFPGALLFRLPFAGRERRADLDAGERLFWHVILSVAWSLSLVLILAALEVYRFERLLWINGALSALLVVAGRAGLLYRGAAKRPSWTLVLPIALVLFGLWRFFPASEYIIGGKDPGTYINEGIQIAQRGTLAIHDPLVRTVPASLRDLFFPPHYRAEYYSNRFMGFFLVDPAAGLVMGQFPHLFPASIAVAYGLDGLTGARSTVTIWAILGVLAVYFAGRRLAGAGAAFAAALLLSLNVVTLWFARYPNAELAMQALLFAALLAFARAHQDDDRFFAPIAGWLAGLLIFLRTIDALLALVAIVGAVVLVYVVSGRRPRFGFLAVLAACALIGWFYMTGPMRAYWWLPTVYLANLPRAQMIAAVAGGLVALVLIAWLRRRHAARVQAVVPLVITAVVLLAAGYAWFLRRPGDRLNDYDAYALRAFTDFYLDPIVLVAALVGLVLLARRDFWRDPAFVATLIGFSLFLFFKMKIVPVHFWAMRRFVPVILPGILLLAGAAAFAAFGQPWGRWRIARALIGCIALGIAALQYVAASAPIAPHVEYAGVIPYLEGLASRFGDRDLVLAESRDTGSDVHTLALPLAYIYAKNVLVLSSARPDKVMFRAFLEQALARYERVLFIGGGGTDLVSRRILATHLTSEKARVPEYDAPTNAYPQGVRNKDFDYGIYQLALGTAAGPFSLDVGANDDIFVVRFHARETTEGRTIRWTGRISQIAVVGMTGSEREVTFVMHDGGRPRPAPPARVDVFFDDVPIGAIDVGSGFQTYRVALPPELVARAAARDEPAQLRLASTVWRPRDLIGGSDDRELGVMVDRVEVR